MYSNNLIRNASTGILNSVTVSGNLGNDPFTVQLKDNVQVTRILLAQHEYIKGEKFTYWFHILLYQELAELAAGMLRKGQRVGFTGKLTSRQLITESKKLITITEIRATEFWIEQRSERLAS